MTAKDALYTILVIHIGLLMINYAKGIIYKFINRGKVTDIKIDKEE